MIATISQLEEVTGLLSTIFGWFILIVVIALIFGAIMWVLRVYFLITLIGGSGPSRKPEVGKECPNCKGYSPRDSKFCKNCGNKF